MESFSDLLEPSTPLPAKPCEVMVSTDSTPIEESHAVASRATERESGLADFKSASSKTSESKGRGDGSAQILASSREVEDRVVSAAIPQALAQRALSASLSWDGKAGIKTFTADARTGAAPSSHELSLATSSANSPGHGRASTPSQSDPSDAKLSEARLVGAKSSDFHFLETTSEDLKPSDTLGRSNTLSQPLVSTWESLSIAAPLVGVQSTSLVALNWRMADNLAADLRSVGACSDRANPNAMVTSGTDPNDADRNSTNATDGKTLSASADTIIQSGGIAGTRALPLFEDIASAEAQELASPQVPTHDATEDGDRITAIADVITPAVLAGLTKAAPPDSKTQPGSVSLPRDGSRATNDDKGQTPIAPRSEDEQFAVPPFLASSTTVFPSANAAVKLDFSKSQVTGLKTGLDQSRVSATQAGRTPENVETSGKSTEANGDTRLQSGKDESGSSLNTQTNPSDSNAPAKTIESAPSFSVVASQALSSTMTGDSKNANGYSSAKGSDVQKGQFEAEPTGVAPNQTHAEVQAPYPTSLINSAKLVERIGEAELRLGMRTGEFGSVDIRTSMVRNQFTAEISVERGDLGRVMAAELPGLQNRLEEQRVPVANITLQNHTGSQSAASEQQRPRDGQQANATGSISSQDESLVPAVVALEATTSTSRLDVHM